MRHGILVSILAYSIVVVFAPAAMARDELEDVVIKQQLDARDRATMDAIVKQRVRRLSEASSDAKDREAARDKLLETARNDKATPAGLAAYAQICADELAPIAANSSFSVGFDTALVTVGLNHENAAPSLAAALRSEHAAVRYLAARGIESLHAKLAGDRQRCEMLLGALGEAGAKESDDFALRMIYQAINFSANVPNFQFGDRAAMALGQVFDARLSRISRKGCVDLSDSAAVTAAEGCYSKADESRRSKLIGFVGALLSAYVDRYYDPDVASECLAGLAEVASRAEAAVQGMMKASNVSPPSDEVSRLLRPNRRSAQNAEATRSTLGRMLDLLRDSPWKLP